METRTTNSNQMGKAPLYLFGLLGASCFAICAFISLIIGIGWLVSGIDYVFDQWWIIAIPVALIIWGVVPLLAIILYYRQRSR